MDFEKYIELFSKERIESYASTQEHDENLELIAKLTEKLAIIELVMRNRIDTLLKKESTNWLYDLSKTLHQYIQYPNKKDFKSRMIDKINKEIDLNRNTLTNNQLVSRLNFGFWIDLSYFILNHKSKKYYFNDILDISNLELIKYSNLNRKINDNNLKLGFVLKLIQKIRNRAFHWENLLKDGEIITKNNRKIKSPSIYATLNKITIGVMPENIELFVNDVLKCLDEEIFEKYKFPLEGASRSESELQGNYTPIK